MTEIEPSDVDAALEEIERIPVSRIPAEMSRAGREQPELLAFILGSAEGMAPGVGELAGFVYFVIWRTFRNCTRGKLPTITSETFQAKLLENEQTLMRLEDANAPALDEGTVAQLTRQPAVFAYMLQAIGDAQHEGEAPLELSGEDQAAVVLLLKTAIDTLDEARREVLR